MAKHETATGGDKPNAHPDQAGDSADRRAHGAHGKGGSKEIRRDAATPQADGSNTTQPDAQRGETTAPRGEGARGSAGWGNPASGGSVIDKRAPDE